MKNLRKYIGVALVAGLVGVVTAQAADVKVKFSGPSGQGDLIYWSPVTGLTNMVMGSNGTVVVRVLTADTITASATNITAGTTLNAVNGVNVTNITGANIKVSANAGFTGVITNGIGLAYTNRVCYYNGFVTNVYITGP